MAYAVFSVLIFGTISPVLADEACYRPYPPVVSQDLFHEFQDDIKAEFEEYFKAIEAYVACIDRARSAIFIEAKDAAQNYAALFEASK